MTPMYHSLTDQLDRVRYYFVVFGLRIERTSFKKRKKDEVPNKQTTKQEKVDHDSVTRYYSISMHR